MTQAEYTERYLKFMREYSAKLPIDLSPEERLKQTLAAAEEFFENDMAPQIQQINEDLDHLHDSALVEGGQNSTATEQDQMAAIRQTL